MATKLDFIVTQKPSTKEVTEKRVILLFKNPDLTDVVKNPISDLERVKKIGELNKNSQPERPILRYGSDNVKESDLALLESDAETHEFNGPKSLEFTKGFPGETNAIKSSSRQEQEKNNFTHFDLYVHLMTKINVKKRDKTLFIYSEFGHFPAIDLAEFDALIRERLEESMSRKINSTSIQETYKWFVGKAELIERRIDIIYNAPIE